MVSPITERLPPIIWLTPFGGTSIWRASSVGVTPKVEMLFAYLKRNLGFARLRLRGLRGAEDEFLLAATAQNLKRLAKLAPA